MSFVNLCGILAISSAALLLISPREKEIFSLISVIMYLFTVAYAVGKGAELFENIRGYFDSIGAVISIEYLLRSGGIAIVGAIAASVCEDVGQRQVAKAIETVTAVEILSVILPVCKEMFEKLLTVFGE